MPESLMPQMWNGGHGCPRSEFRLQAVRWTTAFGRLKAELRTKLHVCTVADEFQTFREANLRPAFEDCIQLSGRKCLRAKCATLALTNQLLYYSAATT